MPKIDMNCNDDFNEKRLDRSFTKINEDILNSSHNMRHRSFSQDSVQDKERSGSIPFMSQLSTYRRSDVITSENIENSLLTHIYDIRAPNGRDLHAPADFE